MIPILESMLPQPPPAPPPPTVELLLLWECKVGYPIEAVSISSGGNYIAMVGDNYEDGCNDVLYLLTSDGELVWKKKFSELFGSLGDWIHDVSISKNGNYIAVGSDDSTYLLQNDGTLLWEYENGESMNFVSISEDGGSIAVGTYDGWIHLLNHSGYEQWNYSTIGSVISVSISVDDEYVTCGDTRGYVYFFDKNGNLIWDEKIIDYSDMHASASSEGEYIWVGVHYYGGQLGLLNRSGDWVLPLINVNSSPEAISVPSGGELLFVALGKYVDVYNLTAQAHVGSFEARELVNDLDITLNGDYLVTGSDDMRVYFLQVELNAGYNGALNKFNI